MNQPDNDWDSQGALRAAMNAALAAGEILREMIHRVTVREKGPNDFVTDADTLAQDKIQEILIQAFPGYAFVAEESTTRQQYASHGMSSNWRWIVDPIDGTANFVHGLHGFAVSIALAHGNQIYLGVIYDPVSNEMFTAKRGSGAFLNGEVIRCSGCKELSKAMIAVSFPPKLERDSIEIKQFVEMLLTSQSVRRLGSAALNLCYVASGRLDAYWARKLHAWDVAAGILIAEESGAIVSNHRLGPFDIWVGELLVTASPNLQNQIAQCLEIAG